jgi:hypothetical protein
MKVKFILFLIWLTVSGLASIAGTIIKVYEFTNPVIDRAGKYSVISFEGSLLLGEPGKATIPFYPVELLLPPGEIAKEIRIEYEKPFVLPGKFDLLPRQRTRPISEGEQEDWLIDNEFYRSNKSYPSSFKPGLATHFMNGYAIALSAFTPVRYVPSLKEVTYYQRVVVTIETAPDPEWQTHRLNFIPSEQKAGEVAMIIQNPEKIAQYYSVREFRTDNYDYLIITKNQYLPEFDTLISFYKPRGILTKVATTEYISAVITTGVDLQEKIRNYIIGEYQQHGIEYVLIGGDVEVVPYRGLYCQVLSGSDVYSDNGIPADLYYSALDGNWNNDGDTHWGETDEDDLYPEVGIGRMTFSDTDELHHMLHKTMLYQSDPVENELTKPILAGEWLYGSPVTWGSDYLKLLVGYRTDNGYVTHGIPPEHPRDTLYDEVASWSAADLRNHINSGRPWVHHVGHANYTYAMKMSNGDITNANFSQANGINHNYTIVYTHGCMCGGFNEADCIAERMVGIDNFAVAFIGNSRYGWFNQGTTDGPSQHLHREFMDAVYYDSLYHIGMAHLKSKSETAPFVEISGEFEPGATRWCFYDNNLLGDPMMAVWTEELEQVDADFPGFIPIGAESVSLNLSGPAGVYHNFTCSIYRNDTLFGTAKTDVSGSVSISLGDGITEGPISLIVSGYNIVPHYFDIQVCDYWLGLNTDWNDPDNWFTHAVPDSSTNVMIPAYPPGGQFPIKNKNSSHTRQCKLIYFEPGANFSVGYGETFTVGGD